MAVPIASVRFGHSTTRRRGGRQPAGLVPQALGDSPDPLGILVHEGGASSVIDAGPVSGGALSRHREPR
jgi:hypothetical protein